LDLRPTICMRTGEIENVDRKHQKDLARTPDQRRAIGWLHDAILKVKVAGIDIQVGFGEVVGNACEQNDAKLCEDQQKLMKAMQLALNGLRQLASRGTQEQNHGQLETFGLLVYKRDFTIYSMHWVDGLYLVDQVDGFAIPDTANQLDQISSIIEVMMAFKFRVMNLRQNIESLLGKTFGRRKVGVITADVVEASPVKKDASVKGNTKNAAERKPAKSTQQKDRM